MNTNTNTSTGTNKGMLAMRAALDAMTPEQRKANAHKAAAASAARKAALRGGSEGERPTATTKARVAPTVLRPFRVAYALAGATAWVGVEAGGPQRAMRAVRKAHAGCRILGCVEAALLGVTVA